MSKALFEDASHAEPREEQLIEIFEPSSPPSYYNNCDSGRGGNMTEGGGRGGIRRRTSSNWLPDTRTTVCMDCHRQFGWLWRKHHCRRCGLIYCFDCSANKITNLTGVNDKKFYRLCNGCINGLIESDQATLISPSTAGETYNCFPERMKKFIATNHQRLVPFNNQIEGDVNLLQFDEEIVITNLHPSSPQSLSPLTLSVAATGNVFSRIAAAALSLPARLRSTTTPTSSQVIPIPRDSTLETCPVCSMSFRRWDGKRRQIHIEECINKTEASGSVAGDRYTVHRWIKVVGSVGKEEGGKECAICYEEFINGQTIAVLNCMCQYHEHCIDSWFERGKFCPFHTG